MRIRFPHQLLCGITLLLLQAAGAQGHVWRVERDGSGDFTTIRPAIEASAPGDTILLGPGRYDEAAPFSLPGWTETTYVPITVDSLTLRGVDREAVIIGPITSNIQGFGPKGVVTDVTITSFHLESVTLENLRDGAYLLARSDVRDCLIRHCYLGLNEFTVGARVDACEFFENGTGIITFTNCSDLMIAKCCFTDNSLGVGVNRSLNVAINSCNFYNNQWSTGGIQYSENCIGNVSNCLFDGPQSGVTIRSQSDVTLTGVRTENNSVGVHCFDGSIVRGTRNVLRGAYAALWIETTSTAYLDGSHILKSGQWAVDCRGFTTQAVDIDLRNNYWGTDDADSISAWIFDGNDPQDPFYETNLSNVLYEPFSPVPVGAKETSVGGLKSMFHRR